VDGIQIWVEGVARAAPQVAVKIDSASAIIFIVFVMFLLLCNEI
jgi:hypothetical protein